jgi:hypothetical protein
MDVHHLSHQRRPGWAQRRVLDQAFRRSPPARHHQRPIEADPRALASPFGSSPMAAAAPGSWLTPSPRGSSPRSSPRT